MNYLNLTEDLPTKTPHLIIRTGVYGTNITIAINMLWEVPIAVGNILHSVSVDAFILKCHLNWHFYGDIKSHLLVNMTCYWSRIHRYCPLFNINKATSSRNIFHFSENWSKASTAFMSFLHLRCAEKLLSIEYKRQRTVQHADTLIGIEMNCLRSQLCSIYAVWFHFQLNWISNETSFSGSFALLVFNGSVQQESIKRWLSLSNWIGMSCYYVTALLWQGSLIIRKKSIISRHTFKCILFIEFCIITVI